MRTVLERAEEVTKELSRLKLENMKLTKLKVAENNPTSGSFRIKGFIDTESFIEIFEFLFAGKIEKYSYSLIQNERTILRYDNAPHHKDVETQPNHKHVKNKIDPLRTPQVSEFVKEVMTLI